MATTTATENNQSPATRSSKATDDERQREIDEHSREASRHFERYDGDMAEARRASEDAIDKIVMAWSDALGLLVPRAWLRPADAIDIAFNAVEQLLNLQRRFINELLGAAGQYAGASNDEVRRHDGEANRRNGMNYGRREGYSTVRSDTGSVVV